MAVLALLLALWQPSVDPEVAVLVERLVEAHDGYPLAEAELEDLLDARGCDRPPRASRWLPTLVARVSWARGRRELILYLSWPLGR
jgi:hypothetical protein